MTQIACESSEPIHNEKMDLVSSSGAQRELALPRFNLKKRPVSVTEDRIGLATVNSAFLTGLFADVAKVQDDSVSVSTEPSDISSESDPRLDQFTSVKKTRISKTKSMTRCGKSFKILAEAESLFKSPSVEADLSIVPPITPTGKVHREDSLHYQLSCVSDASSSDVIGTSQAVQLAFPHLPTTVSANSCSATLARKVSDLQLHVSDSANKESYGWFVEMDNDDVVAPATATADPYASTGDLAFSAPTAPKAANYDAEVEWAKAADTVDDVLGDFF